MSYHISKIGSPPLEAHLRNLAEMLYRSYSWGILPLLSQRVFVPTWLLNRLPVSVYSAANRRGGRGGMHEKGVAMYVTKVRGFPSQWTLTFTKPFGWNLNHHLWCSVHRGWGSHTLSERGKERIRGHLNTVTYMPSFYFIAPSAMEWIILRRCITVPQGHAANRSLHCQFTHPWFPGCKKKEGGISELRCHYNDCKRGQTFVKKPN